MNENKKIMEAINTALAQADERQLKLIAAFVGQLVKKRITPVEVEVSAYACED